MKYLPALRGKIGIWNYYVCNLSFNEVNEYVKRIDNELHSSSALSDLIQRNITENYKSIMEYILKQDERFFNSLVLAVYDGDPEWIEVELNFDDNEYFNMGFLKLSGKEKIFPVDGQHRVEGIKKSLESKSELANETIPAIFIGHTKSTEGIKRTRRIFSTLNRYAKPVSARDIIALDEDDIVAIITREIVENHDLF
ncbi:DndB, partial [Flavobacterium sp. IR1]